MQSVAVGWQVFQITHRPLDLGYVGLVQFLPGILLSLVAGHTADRFDRRGVLLTCNISYALCSLLLFLQARAGIHSVLPIFAVLLLIGITRAFSGPVSQALVPQVVPQEHFGNAVAWGASIFQVSSVIGPALGGLIYGWAHGATSVYGTAVCMYSAAFSFILMMHVRTGRMEAKDVSLDTVLAGFRYVWQEKIILGSISLDLFAVLLGGAIALLPVFAQDILHIGPRGLGVLRSMPAAGAALMAVWLAYRPLRRRSGVTMFYCYHDLRDRNHRIRRISVGNHLADRSVRDRRVRHDQRRHPQHARADRHASSDARTRERGQFVVHRSIE